MKQAILLNVEIENDTPKESILGVIEDVAVLGSGDAASIKINDWRCSGIHALIKKVDEDTYRIIDLGSTYGTHHAKIPITQLDLKEGETFSIGNHQLVIKSFEDQAMQHLPIYDSTFDKDEIDNSLELPTQKTALKVSLYWGEKLIEVKQFKQGDIVSIGNPEEAIFGTPEIMLDNGQLSHKFDLAKYENGQLTLMIPKIANGLLWTDGKVVNLDTLRFYRDIVHEEGGSKINLRIGDKAHIEFGELVFVFCFVAPASKVKTRILPKLDKQITSIILALLFFYGLLLLLVSVAPKKETKTITIDDIPKHMKKVIYDIGIKNAKEKRMAAVGDLSNNEGGRARGEEGKASANKDTVQKAIEKVDQKTETKIPQKDKALNNKNQIAVQIANAQKNTIDFDKSFEEAAPKDFSNNLNTIESNVKVEGNTASAIANGLFARGSKGLGSGGGGTSVGVGALKGNGTGGGMGAGDYGLKPSRGTEIGVPDASEVEIVGGLDADVIAKIIKRYLPQIQYCYEQQLVSKPSLKGKVAVSFVISAAGTVINERVIETTLKDHPTEACILGKIKKWTFPMPRGGGTVGVNYPFILMSNNSK